MATKFRTILIPLLIIIAFSGCGLVTKTRLNTLAVTVNGINVEMVNYTDGNQIYPQHGGTLDANSRPVIKVSGIRDYIGSNLDYGMGITVLDPYYKGEIKSLVAKQSAFDLTYLFTSTCMMYLTADSTFKYGEASPYNVHFSPLPLKYSGKHTFAFAVGKSVRFDKRNDLEYQAPALVGAISFDVVGGETAVTYDQDIALQLKEPHHPGSNVLEQFKVFNLQPSDYTPAISWSGAPASTAKYKLVIQKMVKNKPTDVLELITVWEIGLPADVTALRYGETIESGHVVKEPESLANEVSYVINIIALDSADNLLFTGLGFFTLTLY